MAELKQIILERGWGLLLVNLGIQPENLLERVKLPIDLLKKDPVRVSIQGYFSLWESLTEEAQDPELPLRMGELLKELMFSPVFFAALSCQNLDEALKRISQFKRVTTQLQMDVETKEQSVSVSLTWNTRERAPPPMLVMTELLTLLHIARIGTGINLKPREVIYPYPFSTTAAYEVFFGTPIKLLGSKASITFSSEDTKQTFNAIKESLWSKFEPELQLQPEQFETDKRVSERVRLILIECLPAGEASIDDVAKRLNTSRRTLQRQLKSEGSIFRSILQNVREHFANHYLVKTSISYAEIALLLGFHEPSSFFRAFRSWRNTTPESVRLNRVSRQTKHITSNSNPLGSTIDTRDPFEVNNHLPKPRHLTNQNQHTLNCSNH